MMDSIEEMLLLLGGLMILAIALFYIIPSSTSLSSEFSGEAISQIIQNSFKLTSPEINSSVDYASIYDSGFPTTLLVEITEYNASNNQVVNTVSKKVSFSPGLNEIAIPTATTNSYYEIDLYDTSGDVLYTTYYVYKYVNDYAEINNIFGDTKIFVNGEKINPNIFNNSVILSLPSGSYNITVFTPFYYYSSVVGFPLSTPYVINIPSNHSSYVAYVDQLLPGNKLNPLPNAVISLNDQTATYKTGSYGNVSIEYSPNATVSLNVYCPPSTCGTSITNNYTSLSGIYTTKSFSSSNPFILYPRFRVISNLYLNCNSTLYPTPGSISIISTPKNSSKNRYSSVNASGQFISYLYSGLYNVTGISLSGLFNSTAINVTHFNQTLSLSFPYCSSHIPHNETIFSESGLPSNTLWNVTYGSAINKSTTNRIVFSEVNTQVNYTYSIPSVSVNKTVYIPIPASGASQTGKQINVKFVSSLPILTISPNPATVFQTINITATCASTSDQCDIYYPNLNTELSSGVGKSTYTYQAGSLSSGKYSSFYAVDKTYNVNGTPQTLTVTSGTPPTGIKYYVPITITNSQSLSTQAPFQQMINITESSYSSYISYNKSFANFEYFYDNNTIIPSWIETNSTGKLITWLKISNGIPANSKITVYLGFANKTTNLLSSSGTTGSGEAPQLSPTYAEYDDGASVFNNYWNFAGTSLPTGWVTSSSSITASVNNGVTLTSSSDNQYLGYNTAIPSSSIFEIYSEITKANDQSTEITALIGGSLDSTVDWAGESSDSNEFGYGIAGAWGHSTSTWNSNTFYMNGVGATSSGASDYVNYSVLANSASSGGLSNIYLMMWQDNSTTVTQYARTRAYPPDGSMPSYTFGTIS